MPVLSREFLVQMAAEQGLSPKQTEVFLLRFAEDKDYSAIQEILDISTDACSQLMSQVYRRLSIKGQTRGKESQLLSFLISKSQETDTAKLKSSPTSINWRQVGQTMLEDQNLRALTTNPLTAGEGVRFEVEQMYVPVAMVERQQQARRSDNVSPEQGSKLYQPEVQDEVSRTLQNDKFFEQVLKEGKSPKSRGKRIAIIGTPGAGKTTFLQKIADWVFQTQEQDMAIWISLADLQGITLEKYLLQEWLKNALAVVRVSPEMEEALAEQFKQKKVWLLLDGLDEMDSGIVNPLAALAKQLTGWVAQARVVLTCRLNVWDAGKNVLEDEFDVYRSLNFNSEQVRQFIDKWFANAIRPDLKERLLTELNQLEQRRIGDTVKNPLRLALLCNIWQQWQGGLPQTQAALYKRFVDALYEWKQEHCPTNSEQRQELNQALGELALKAISQSSSQFRLRHRLVCEVLGEPDTPLFQLALNIGWLNIVGVAAEAPDEKVYAFFHPTFQEYFAAQVIDNWRFFLNPQEQIYPIFESRWMEVISLWGERKDVSQEEKEEFMKELIKTSYDLLILLKDPAARRLVEKADKWIALAKANIVKALTNTSRSDAYFRCSIAGYLGAVEPNNLDVIDVWINLYQHYSSPDSKIEWIANTAKHGLKQIISKNSNEKVVKKLKELLSTSQEPLVRELVTELLESNQQIKEEINKSLQQSLQEQLLNSSPINEKGQGEKTSDKWINIINYTPPEAKSCFLQELEETASVNNDVRVFSSPLSKLIELIESDTEGLFSSQYIPKYPEANFKALVKRRVVGDESWKDISKSWEIPEKTLSSFYNRCIKELSSNLWKYLKNVQS